MAAAVLTATAKPPASLLVNLLLLHTSFWGVYHQAICMEVTSLSAVDKSAETTCEGQKRHMMVSCANAPVLSPRFVMSV